MMTREASTSIRIYMSHCAYMYAVKFFAKHSLTYVFLNDPLALCTVNVGIDQLQYVR